jgi:hypothetical protein
VIGLSDAGIDNLECNLFHRSQIREHLRIRFKDTKFVRSFGLELGDPLSLKILDVFSFFLGGFFKRSDLVHPDAKNAVDQLARPKVRFLDGFLSLLGIEPFVTKDLVTFLCFSDR